MKKLLLFLMLLVTSITSWAEDPYFEVIDGSFSSGNVTVKFTFPEATTVSVTGSIYLDHYDKPSDVYVTASGSAVSTEGNTVTAIFTYTPWAGISESGYSFWSGGITAEGYSQYSNIHAKPVPPYAEVLSGSLTSGTIAVKVTFPNISTIAPDLGYSYTISLWNNDVKLDTKTSSGDVSVTGNTLSTTFNFSTQADDDLSAALIKVDKWAIKLDGAWNEAMEISFSSSTPEPSGCEHANLTHHAAVAPTYEAAGNIAYDECDDCHLLFAATDTEHETPITIEDTVLPVLVMDVTNGIDPYFKVTSGSFASGNVTVKITFPQAATLSVPNYMALQYNGSSWENELKQLNGTGYTIEGNVITATFSGFSAPAGADENKYSIKVDGVAEDGGEPMYYAIIRPAYAFPYAEVVEGSLATMNATVKVTFPFAESITVPSYEDCILKPKAMDEASFYTRNTEVTTEGNAIFIPFTAHETMFYTGRPEDFTVQLCETYSYDEVSYNRIGYSNIVFRPTDDCTHEDCIFTDEVLATPETPGMMAYNRCKRCGKLFAATDVNRETPVEMEDLVIAATCDHNFNGGHECVICHKVCEHKYMRHFENRDATCIHEGIIEHWQCVDCNTLFSNKAATTQTTAGAVNTGLISHNFNNINGVCHYCGKLEDDKYPPACLHPNAWWHVIGRKTYNCAESGERYMHCNYCYRYWLQQEDGIAVYMTLDQIENEIALGHDVHHGSLKVVEEKDATCTEMGYGRHKYCSTCNRVYPINMRDAECTIWNALEKGLGDDCVYKEAPHGHNFVDGQCTECGYVGKYVEVTTNAGISITGKYILVSKFGDQYYALSNDYYQKYEDENQSWIYPVADGVNYPGVPVTRDVDGSITINDNNVAELTFTGKRLYWYTQNKTNDGLASKVKNYMLYDQKMGYLTTDSYFSGYDLKVLHGQYNSKHQPSALANRYRLDHYSYDRSPGSERNFMIYNGQKTSINGLNNYCDVWDGSIRKVTVANLPVCDYGSLMFTQPGYSNVWKGMYAAKESNGDVVFGFADDYGHKYDVENLAPVHLYVIASEKFIGVEDTQNAMVCGPVTSQDIENISQQIAENNAIEVAELKDLKETDGTVDEGAEVEPAAVSLSVIDCSHAIFEDGLASASLESLRESEYVSKNGLFLLGKSAKLTGKNIIVDGECVRLVLTDKFDATIPVDFTALAASYERVMSGASQWGTLCLPFAISSNDDMQLYSLSAVDSESGTGVLTFTPIESAEAGQAVVFKKKESASGIMASAENAQLTAGTAESIDTDVTNWAIKGSYTKTTIQSNVDADGNADNVKRYYIASDKFWNAAVEATVPAFRAWFENVQTDPAAAKPSYTIFVEEEDATSVLNINADGELEECTEIYDLSGKKLERVVKGQVNIINGKKIFVK